MPKFVPLAPCLIEGLGKEESYSCSTCGAIKIVHPWALSLPPLPITASHFLPSTINEGEEPVAPKCGFLWKGKKTEGKETGHPAKAFTWSKEEKTRFVERMKEKEVQYKKKHWRNYTYWIDKEFSIYYTLSQDQYRWRKWRREWKQRGNTILWNVSVFFHISLINNEYYSFTRAIKQPAIRISVNLYRVFIRCLAGVRFNIGVDFLIRLPFGFLPPERWVVLGMFIPVQY